MGKPPRKGGLEGERCQLCSQLNPYTVRRERRGVAARVTTSSLPPPGFRNRNPGESFRRFPVGGERSVPGPPEVAKSFPGRCEVEEDSEWVAAAAALRGGVSPEALFRIWGSAGDLFPLSPQFRGSRGGDPFFLRRRAEVDGGTKTRALHASTLRFEGSFIPKLGFGRDFVSLVQ